MHILYLSTPPVHYGTFRREAYFPIPPSAGNDWTFRKLRGKTMKPISVHYVIIMSLFLISQFVRGVSISAVSAPELPVLHYKVDSAVLRAVSLCAGVTLYSLLSVFAAGGLQKWNVSTQRTNVLLIKYPV